MNSDPTPVRYCVCANVSFVQIKESGVKTLEEAREKLGVAKVCRICEPYIEKTLETGVTAFDYGDQS